MQIEYLGPADGEYRPGACNIGRREIAKRRTFGAIGMAFGAEAADMPDLPVLRGSMINMPTRTWDGWYVGGQGSYSAMAADFSASNPPLVEAKALYRASTVAFGFVSRNGVKLCAPGPSQTMLLSFEPSNSNSPSFGFVHVRPSLLSA